MPKGIKGFQKGMIAWNKGKSSGMKGKHIQSNNALEKWRKNGGIPWNKGSTKNTDIRIKKYGENSGKKRKGMKITEEHRKNISNGQKGHRNYLPKGYIPWNKGRKMWEGKKHPRFGRQNTKESIEKQRKSHLGKSAYWNKGEKSSNWKGGITPLRILIHNSFKWRLWRGDIFSRDNFICQKCNKRGGKLEAHHIKSFSKIIAEYQIKTLEQALACEELWNINNGITLCEECHKETYNYLSNKK